MALACGFFAQRPLAGDPLPGEGALRSSGSAVAATAALPWLLGGLVIAPFSEADIMGADTFAGPIRFGIASLFASLAYAVALYRAFIYPFTERPSALPAPGRDTAVLGAVGGYVLSRDVSGMLANAPLGSDRSDPSRALAEVTPASEFYVVSKNFSDPEVNSYDWRLKIDGLVGRPMPMTLETIKALPAVRQYVTLQCISNRIGGDLISNGQRTGVRVADLLGQVGVRSTAAYFITEAEDGYYESMPLSEALQEQMLLVYEMNGQPLTYKHGFPLRLLYPSHYGMKSTKWITLIQLADGNTEGYWTERGWDPYAVVRTMSKINYPSRFAEIPQGDITVTGVAFAGARGISTVEVSADGQETWRPAVLRPALGKFALQLWSFTWRNPEPRVQIIVVRAVDGEGKPQETGEGETFPKGSADYHTVPVKVL